MITVAGGMIMIDATVIMTPEQATAHAMDVLAAIDQAKAQREHANGEVPTPESAAAKKRRKASPSRKVKRDV